MSKKLTKTIKVSLGNQKRLDRLKKGDFKRKFKTKSINDVITQLLDIYDEYVIIKTQFGGIIETGKIAEQSLKDKIQKKPSKEIQPIDICPDCADFSNCKKPFIRNFERVKNEGCFNIRNECVYRTRNGLTIDCAKDFSKTGRIHHVSIEFCNNCWQRKKAHYQKETVGKSSVSKSIKVEATIGKKDISIVHCPLKGRIFINKPSDLENLPCLKNLNFNCEFRKNCEKHLETLMKKWG